MIESSFSASKKSVYLRMAVIPLALLSLSSCTGIMVGLGAAVGTAAVQEGGISRAASDARIQVDINERWFKYNVNMFTKLDLTVNQGRVLITGVVQDPEHRVQAVRLAWQPTGVVQVINEAKVADSEGFIGFAKDTWITGRVRTSLIMDRDVESINYSIDTVQGSVYLMGFAQDQGELNHVIEIARTIGGVKRVVSYVKLVGVPENREGAQDYQMPYDSSAPVVGDNNTAAAGVQGANAAPVTWEEESVY
ncbi:MAG: BON domain-containing protein [Alphaproteobacteria bacterium]|nr:BON domain-containing protein [Alphaproteobacteria bacterium]